MNDKTTIEDLQKLSSLMRRTGKTENFIKSIEEGDIIVTNMDLVTIYKLLGSELRYKNTPLSMRRDICDGVDSSCTVFTLKKFIDSLGKELKTPPLKNTEQELK